MASPRQLTLAASHGLAIELAKGQSVKIVNTHGSQVVDTWAFAIEQPEEYLSMPVTRRLVYRLMPKAGDALFSNRRRPLLTMTEDTSPGIHDTLFTCCDRFLYEQLGCTEYHRNCADNLVEAMQAIGREPSRIPDPLNLFMNIPWTPDGMLSFEETVSVPGDYVVLKAEMDLIIAFSACPQDIVPINGVSCIPTEAHFLVLDG